MQDKILKTPPTHMPKSPEALFEFLAHGELYEGETETDFSDRQATLANLITSMHTAEQHRSRIVVPGSESQPLINRLITRILR